ncbi:MAG TPA: DUF2891 family protein, partial [Acidobacteria bacterium]|nr:DUF2891 family protein [Acidobacteriota bacterium]
GMKVCRYDEGNTPVFSCPYHGWSYATDGKLVHLDGLNLSRAWMLEGIAAGLPEDDARRAALRAAAAAHREAGLAAVSGAHYEGGHWLGTFAMYLVTERGVAR